MANIPLVAWLIAGICFILSLGGLSQHQTARRGNLLGIIGISLAIIAALFYMGSAITPSVAVLLIMAIGIGSLIGSILAKRVAMTAMPQLVAILHSFVGLAAVLVGLSVYLWPVGHLEVGDAGLEVHHDLIQKIEIVLGRFYRRIDLHGFGHRLGQVGRQGGQQAAHVTGPAFSQPADDPGLCGSVDLVCEDRIDFDWPDSVAASDVDFVRLWRPYGDGDWWRGYAGRCFDVEQLFRMGGGRNRIHVFQ